MILTFEMADKNECVEIHGDRDGLLKLAKTCKELADSQPPDHSHLMTEEWGGPGLTSDKQGVENELVNHVKLFRWAGKDKV